MKITRDVIVDLWPTYLSGEASADTRALVDEFLGEHPELARALREERTAELEPIPLALQPDHEMKTLTETRKAIYLHNWPLFLAILFTCFAFGRIVADTSWDVSPRGFAVTGAIAGAFWIFFLVRLVRQATALR